MTLRPDARVTSAEREFRDFAKARSGPLLRTAYLLTGDHHHAEDLLQVTLTKLFVAWPRVRHKEAAEAYARRTLVTTYTSWRRRKSWHEQPTDLAADGSALIDAIHPDGSADLAEHDRLWRCLHTLSRQQRAVVVLRFVEDASVDEAARMLGITTGSVKTHTSRALATMRIRLDQAEDAAITEGGARR